MNMGYTHTPPAAVVVDGGQHITFRLKTFGAAEPDKTALQVAHANTSATLLNCAVRSTASSTDLSASAAEGLCAAVRVVDGARLIQLVRNNTIVTTGAGAAGLFATGRDSRLWIAGNITTTGPHSPCIAMTDLSGGNLSRVRGAMQTSGAHSPIVHVAQGSLLVLEPDQLLRGVASEASGPASQVAVVDGASLWILGGTHVAVVSNVAVVRPGSDVLLKDSVLRAGEEVVLVDGTAGRGRGGNTTVGIHGCALQTGGSSVVRVVAAMVSITMSFFQAYGNGALLVAQNSSVVALEVEQGSQSPACGDVLADETSAVTVQLRHYSGVMRGARIWVALSSDGSSWNVTGTSRILGLSAEKPSALEFSGADSAVICGGPAVLEGGSLVLHNVNTVPEEPRVLVHSDVGVRGIFGTVSFDPLSFAAASVEVAYTANDVVLRAATTPLVPSSVSPPASLSASRSAATAAESCAAIPLVGAAATLLLALLSL
eukprot:m51a1_g11212 hypothetical protein (486) ;mRNA; f:41826-43402